MIYPAYMQVVITRGFFLDQSAPYNPAYASVSPSVCRQYYLAPWDYF